MTVYIDVCNLFGCQGGEGCNFGAEIDAARFGIMQLSDFAIV